MSEAKSAKPAMSNGSLLCSPDGREGATGVVFSSLIVFLAAEVDTDGGGIMEGPLLPAGDECDKSCKTSISRELKLSLLLLSVLLLKESVEWLFVDALLFQNRIDSLSLGNLLLLDAGKWDVV